MALILGIDTGGTFTDSVVVDTKNRDVICKAKALTTRADLSKGITASLDRLPEDAVRDVSFVALSTTLATNAIVEQKHCRTGLILIGTRPEGKLPADVVKHLDADINIKGQILKDLSDEELDQAIESLADTVDVVAVSGFASVRNPEHENRVRDRILARTELPVVCAHELTGQLGYYERTVTCVLNAGLLPVIRELMQAVHESLTQKGIHAPLMIVRGDGSLIRESVALIRPVETLLSGPAASVIGAGALTDLQYGMILDMGGTTTDIADLTNNKTRISREGAVVDGWQTRVRAVEVCTYGLGGDSYIYYDNQGVLQIGPRKVIPICVLSEECPDIVREMTEFRKPDGYELCREKSTDCFRFLRDPRGDLNSPIKEKILKLLKEKPHSLYWLADHFGKDADKLGLSEMVEDGLIERASITPTDLLVAEGHLKLYDRAGAQIAVTIMADLDHTTEKEFIIRAKRMIYRRIASLCIQSACSFEGRNFNMLEDDSAGFLLDVGFGATESNVLKAAFTLKKPILAIGAPVKAWLYNVGQYLNTAIIIPEHAEVANAVGAAMAEICEERQASIRSDSATDKYIIFTQKERVVEDSLEQAKETAARLTTQAALQAAEEAGGTGFNVHTEQEDKYIDIFSSGKRKYAETIVTTVVTGKPACLEHAEEIIENAKE